MANDPAQPVQIPAAFTYGEVKESRQAVIGQDARFIQKFKGQYAIVAALLLARGATGTPAGTTGNWVVVESGISPKLKGGNAVVSITWQGYFWLPPDTADIKRENLQPRIERHPLFASLTPLDFSIVQGAAKAPNAAMRNIFTQQLAGTSNPTLATLLYNKFLLGEETYYCAGVVHYTWTTHYAIGTQPVASRGGFIQSPAVYGAIPLLASLPANASYLREADDVNFVGGLQAVVRFTRTWLGVDLGFWDNDLYS